MHRRLSSLVKGSHSHSSVDFDNGGDIDSESKVSTTVARDEPLPIPSLKIKRVDYYYSRWGKQWKYRVRFAVLRLAHLWWELRDVV